MQKKQKIKAVRRGGSNCVKKFEMRLDAALS
jgi:hypothetical protein